MHVEVRKEHDDSGSCHRLLDPMTDSNDCGPSLQCKAAPVACAGPNTWVSLSSVCELRRLMSGNGGGESWLVAGSLCSKEVESVYELRHVYS
ncbi:hypothetical protein IQ06DRAFT_52178 [Phaeosphaeriaceae sp. SRC1lsM3a]|nr:hypothetical protein IQ06DRAFT_52178 [Stagonospora sp. SRC1lsM3a]